MPEFSGVKVVFIADREKHFLQTYSVPLSLFPIRCMTVLHVRHSIQFVPPRSLGFMLVGSLQESIFRVLVGFTLPEPFAAQFP